MRFILFLVFLVSGFSVTAALPLETAVYHEKPTLKWFRERIALHPKGFDPDLGLKGIEEILFAPGMFKADQPDFFSCLSLCIGS